MRTTEIGRYNKNSWVSFCASNLQWNDADGGEHLFPADTNTWNVVAQNRQTIAPYAGAISMMALEVVFNDSTQDIIWTAEIEQTATSLNLTIGAALSGSFGSSGEPVQFNQFDRLSSVLTQTTSSTDVLNTVGISMAGWWNV